MMPENVPYRCRDDNESRNKMLDSRAAAHPAGTPKTAAWHRAAPGAACV